MTSGADHIRTQLQQTSGDIRATWRTAQSLLHSRQKVICDDSECADFVGKFSSFFVDKVRRIRDNIASALQQSNPRMFAARPHTGLELSDFQPVTIDEVRKLLASIPRKTLPLYVLPVSLLKDVRRCLRTDHHHTCQLVTADRKVPSTLQISAGAAATEEGGARQVVASQLQADITACTVVRVQAVV